MSKFDLRERSYKFGVEAIKFFNGISSTALSLPLFRQVIRSATSIGANIEESDSSPARKDFRHKLVIAKKEAAETIYWLRMIRDAELLKNDKNRDRLGQLLDEAEQLTKILGSILHKL